MKCLRFGKSLGMTRSGRKKRRKRREKGKDWRGEKYHSMMTIFLVADLEGEI